MSVYLPAIMSLLLFASPAGSHCEARASADRPQTNKVELKIVRDGAVIGTPELTLQVGSSATMTLATERGFRVQARLTEDDRLVDGRKLDLDLSVRQAGDWRRVAWPSLSARVGSVSSVSLVDADGRTLIIEMRISAGGNATLQSRGNGEV